MGASSSGSVSSTCPSASITSDIGPPSRGGRASISTKIEMITSTVKRRLLRVRHTVGRSSKPPCTQGLKHDLTAISPVDDYLAAGGVDYVASSRSYAREAPSSYRIGLADPRRHRCRTRQGSVPL